MKIHLKRILAVVLAIAILLPSTMAWSPAVSAEENAQVDLRHVYPADASGEYALLDDVLAEATQSVQTQEQAYAPDDAVCFIVSLNGDALLDTKPESQSVTDFMQSATGKRAVQKIQMVQANVKRQIDASETGFTVKYRYSVVLNGFAVVGPYAAKSELAAMDGVKSVAVSQTYEYVEPTEGYTQAALTSGEMMDSDRANAEGYTGKGTVTAVLDTGLDTTHEAFVNAPESAALSRTDVQDTVENLNAQGNVYVNEKVPFAYDYADSDNDVYPVSDHGTHVAGSVGADCDQLTGVAPDTQLVICKVFSDTTPGASDVDIFAALEDCLMLGVDTVNMSLGTPSGFSEADEVTNGVYQKVKDAGINLLVSAGNDYSSTYKNNLGTDLPLVDEPDNAIVGSPSTYSSSLSVASVEEEHVYTVYFRAGEEKLIFTDSNTGTEKDFVEFFNGQELDYVYVPGFGTEADFATVNVSGKIALVARGSIAFTEKEAHAAAAGAVGVIVYDNVEGDLINMQTNAVLPMIFVSKRDGLYLRELEEKKISVSTDYAEVLVSDKGGQMSDFSSLGVAPDLTLKPEITAPGGNVYSALPGNRYGNMSGTSMASPHMAGAASVVRQYLNETYPDLTANQKQNLTNTLLMNTAVPLEDETGVTYSPRKQGAGLAQVYGAIHTAAYVTVDGSQLPKAELGDSAGGYFSKTVNLTVHNLSKEDQTYQLSAINLTTQVEKVVAYGTVYDCISASDRVLTGEEFQTVFSDSTVTVPAGGEATVTVKLRLTKAGEASLAAFSNGAFLEGYLVLDPTDEDGVQLSVPYLGFYGDWGAASVFDDTIYDEEAASVYPSTMALLNVLDGSGFYMGMNLFTDGSVVDADKIAVSTTYLSNYYRPFTMLGLLRAPKRLTYTITDAEGSPIPIIDEDSENWDTYDAYTRENVIKSFYYGSGGYTSYEMGPTGYGWLPASVGDDGYAYYLPEGDYTIHITAQIDGTDSPAGTQSTAFPISVDNNGPVMLSHTYFEEDGHRYVTLELQDNNYLMGFQLISEDEQTALSGINPVSEETRGAITEVTFDVTELVELGFERAKVYMADYALNESISSVFSLISQELLPTAVHFNTHDITKSGAGTFKIAAWVEPEDAENTDLVWESDRPDIASVTPLDETEQIENPYVNGEYITLRYAQVTCYNISGVATLKISTANGKTDTTTVTVTADIKQLPEDLVIREDGYYELPADLSAKVTIADNAHDVVVAGAAEKTAENPYQNLYLKSEVENLNLTIYNLNGVCSTSTPVISFTGKGNTLTVSGENTLTGQQYGNYALIQTDYSSADKTSAELTVDGTGVLNLTQPTNAYGAALGTAAGKDCTALTINGGNLNITNSGVGAGIGSGSGGAATGIIINGGNIHVDVPYTVGSWNNNASNTGAGIGTGGASGAKSTNITINGGTITGTTETASALIGTGYHGYGTATVGAVITINGGKLNVATKKNSENAMAYGGAAIGSDTMGSAPVITINGGEVLALTTSSAAAIGGGYYGAGGTIYVNGGTVSAYTDCANTNYNAPAIGNGYGGGAGSITISKGAVLADYNTTEPTGGAISYTSITTTGAVQNLDMEDVHPVPFQFDKITGVLVNGKNWKATAPHSVPTDGWKTDYTQQVTLWLPETPTVPSIVTVTADGDVKYCETTVYNDNTWEWYEIHYVDYALTNLTTDAPSKVYDAAEPEKSANLIGTLTVSAEARSQGNYLLPDSITVTVDGEPVPVTYDPETGAFTVEKAYLTGEVVVTAAAMEDVDASEVEALIAQVEAMDPDAYTGESWEALQAALAGAIAAAENPNPSQAEIDAACAALRDALENLTVRADASELEALIAQAETLVGNDYVSSTWSALQTALAAAKAVAANSNATAEEIDAAKQTLQAALDALVLRGDKTALRAAIDEADVLFAKDYTPASWQAANLTAVLEAAVAVYNDPEATQEAVDAAEQALRAALDALDLLADKTALEAQIARAEELDESEYTPATWAALMEAYDAAVELDGDINARQTDVDAAATALECAIASLNLLADKTELEAQMAKAEAENEEDYTIASWAVLAEAYEAAAKLDADPNATQEEVDTAAQALEDALAQLEPGQGELPFTDVAEDDWYYNAVSFVYFNKLMFGMTDTLFAPNRDMTRAQMVTVLYRVEGSPVVDTAVPFTDVPADSYYAKAVAWAYQNKIAAGMSETEFDPEGKLNREQMVSFFARFARYQGIDVSTEEDLSGFTDAATVSSYARASMAWAVETGLVHGMTATTLGPKVYATRAQVAQILKGYYKLF